MLFRSMSANADRNELLRWLSTCPALPKQIVLVHGEPAPMDALKSAIADRFGVTPLTPVHLQSLAI